jgi:hypothetical protein
LVVPSVLGLRGGEHDDHAVTAFTGQLHHPVEQGLPAELGELLKPTESVAATTSQHNCPY